MFLAIGIILGVAIIVLMVMQVLRSLPSDEEERIRKGKQRTQELMATPEGRQWLADQVGGSFKDLRNGGEIPKWKPCPTCEGYGKLGHTYKIIKGAKVELTTGDLCPDCGGTGIEGGMDYENVACPSCEGRGAIEIDPKTGIGAKCGVCQGTKVVQRDKALISHLNKQEGQV